MARKRKRTLITDDGETPAQCEEKMVAALRALGHLGDDDKFRLETETRAVLVDLDQAERAGAGKELADVLGAVEDLKAELKEVKAGFKTRAEELLKEIRRYRRILHDGQDERPLACFVLWNRSQKQRVVIRPDTLEVLEERPMTADERQGVLFGRTGDSVDFADDQETEEDKD